MLYASATLILIFRFIFRRCFASDIDCLLMMPMNAYATRRFLFFFFFLALMLRHAAF